LDIDDFVIIKLDIIRIVVISDQGERWNKVDINGSRYLGRLERSSDLLKRGSWKSQKTIILSVNVIEGEIVSNKEEVEEIRKEE
jgi:hypothetical protein